MAHEERSHNSSSWSGVMTGVTEAIWQVLWLGASRQTPVGEEPGGTTPFGALVLR